MLFLNFEFFGKINDLNIILKYIELLKKTFQLLFHFMFINYVSNKVFKI